MATDLPPQESPAEPSRGCIKGCLILFGILFLLLVVVVVVSAIFWRQLMGGFFTKSLASQIDRTTFPVEQKEQAKAELERLREAFENEQLDLNDLERALVVLTESPIVTLILVESLEQQYLDRSGLTEQEKGDGRMTIKRFAHGLFSRSIDEQTAQSVMAPLGTQGAQGEFQLKTRVSDAELRTFLDRAKQAADDAGVPDEFPPIDLGAEMKRVVDAAINAAEGAPVEGAEAEGAAIERPPAGREEAAAE